MLAVSGKGKAKEGVKGGAPSKASQATKRKAKTLEKTGAGTSEKKKRLDDGSASTVKSSKKGKKKVVWWISHLLGKVILPVMVMMRRPRRPRLNSPMLVPVTRVIRSLSTVFLGA